MKQIFSTAAIVGFSCLNIAANAAALPPQIVACEIKSNDSSLELHVNHELKEIKDIDENHGNFTAVYQSLLAEAKELKAASKCNLLIDYFAQQYE